MKEQIRCYRCGREPSDELKNGKYWCSWCGQEFNPKDATKEAKMYLNKGLAHYEKSKGLYGVVSYSEKFYVDQAILDFTKAIEIDPTYTEAYYNRGIAFRDKGKYDQAILDFTKAIEINPTYTEAYHGRGIAHSKKGQYNEMISDFTKIVEIKASDAEAHFNLGKAYEMNGQFEQAISSYNNAINLNPMYTEAYYNKAIIYDDNGLTNEAIEAYKIYIKMANPNNLSQRRFLGNAKERIKQEEKRRLKEGLCLGCAKSLSFFDKITKRTSHKSCMTPGVSPIKSWESNRKDVANQEYDEILKIKCPKCGEIYFLGEDTLLITDEDAFSTLEALGAIGSRPKNPNPDLAMHAEITAEDKSAILTKIQQIKQDISSGIKRQWYCEKCKSINEYPYTKLRESNNDSRVPY